MSGLKLPGHAFEILNCATPSPPPLMPSEFQFKNPSTHSELQQAAHGNWVWIFPGINHYPEVTLIPGSPLPPLGA